MRMSPSNGRSSWSPSHARMRALARSVRSVLDGVVIGGLRE
jgi:hypothetical protein